MNWLRIRNSGEIAMDALFLLGASTKRDDASKIGFFGSGNKYAIAVLLRLGIPFRIFSGGREVKIEIRDMDFRGQAFGQIVLDGQPTSFTTAMGPTWEPWFAVREFICNAIDEGGASWGVVDDADGEEAGLSGEAGTTTVCVGADRPEIEHFIEEMGTYIREPGASNLDTQCAIVYWGQPEIGIFPARDGVLHFYRHGVLVSSVGEPRKALFSYDFSSCAINESRIASSEWELTLAVKRAIAKSENLQVVGPVIDAILAESDVYEAEFNFDGIKLSQEWCDVFEAKGRQLVPAGMVSYLAPEDQGHYLAVPDDLYDCLVEQFEDRLDFKTRSSKCREVALSPEASEFLAEALGDLAELGYSTEYEIRTVEFRDKAVVAETSTSERRISISASGVEKCAEGRAMRHLKAVLFEEIMHSRGFSDGSRAFEQELIRIALEAIESGAAAKAKLMAMKSML